jgi:hypothetical protein
MDALQGSVLPTSARSCWRSRVASSLPSASGTTSGVALVEVGGFVLVRNPDLDPEEENRERERAPARLRSPLRAPNCNGLASAG